MEVSLVFENDVKMYGTQAANARQKFPNAFENDVKMYGTQADELLEWKQLVFENDVKMYGTQACALACCYRIRLRMM